MLIDIDENVKDIAGFEGVYAITDKGRVYSHSRTIERNSSARKPFSTLVKGRWMKLDYSTPYARVRLQKDGDCGLYSVHRLVAQAFIKAIDGKDMVNHKDGNKLNNHVDNLEWCTSQENDKHAKDYGLLNPARGELHPSAKLKAEDVIFIRGSSLSGAELARKYNVPRSTITKIRKRHSWKHVPEVKNANNTIAPDERSGE